MQTYNPTLLEAAVRGLLIKTMAQTAGAGRYVNALATYFSSQRRSEVFAWIGEAPRMRELGADREIIFDGMSDASYTLAADTWAAGIVVKKEDIEDDELGALRMRIMQLASVAALNPDRLVLQALIDGITNTCYDGAAFFSDSHPARGGAPAQDNLYTGTGTSTAQVSADYAGALAQMTSLVAENGEPYFPGDLTELTIVAGPAMRKPLKEALGAELISNTSNVSVDGINNKILISSRCPDNDWYMLHTGGPVKPLIFLDRVAVKMTAQEDDSDNGFEREQHRFKVRARHTAGYAHWQDAIKINNS